MRFINVQCVRMFYAFIVFRINIILASTVKLRGDERLSFKNND